MAYVSPNYKSKKQLKDDLAIGREIIVYQPELGTVPRDGSISLEGPHYPEFHRWYATGTMQNGKLVKVK